MSASVAIRVRRKSQFAVRAGFALLLAACAAACAPEPEPRSVLFFMEDGLAREGALTRCNRNRDATLNDVECSNARRAAAAIAIEAERARAVELERESERKLVALRQRQAREAAAAEQASAAARAAAEAAYEGQWRGGRPRTDGSAESAAVPTFGVPPGPVMPSMSESDLFEVFATGSEPLRPRGVEVATAEPPANDLTISPPELELAEVAVIPRPFRTDDVIGR